MAKVLARFLQQYKNTGRTSKPLIKQSTQTVWPGKGVSSAVAKESCPRENAHRKSLILESVNLLKLDSNIFSSSSSAVR